MRFLLSALALVVAAPDASACEWPRRMRFRWDQATEVPMLTSRGKPCGSTISYTSAPIDSVRILTRARGGIAAVNTTSVAYKPNDGFVGRDEFSFEVRSRVGRRGSPETATVKVIVTVAP